MPLLLVFLLAGVALIVFEGTALAASGGDFSVNYSPSIVAFAKAIAKAEGFGVPGAIPTLANNPGDLVIPEWTGQSLGSQNISVFSSAFDGWNHLYSQLELIVAGKSREYTLNDTIRSMAGKWAPGDADTWGYNVAGALGVTIDTPLSDVLGG